MGIQEGEDDGEHQQQQQHQQQRRRRQTQEKNLFVMEMSGSDNEDHDIILRSRTSTMKPTRRKKRMDETAVTTTTTTTMMMFLTMLVGACVVVVQELLVGSNMFLLVDASWVDPDTSDSDRTTVALTEGDDREYHIVFSDEFEQEGRTFHDGHDPRWTALTKNDYTNEALHYYSSDNARTTNGVLNLTTEHKVNWYKAYSETDKVFYADRKYIQTAMLQGWNKFCFTGGIIEVSAKLPGNPKTGGLWPAIWMMGNLARATYVGSTDWIWPYSYDECDSKTRHSQRITACAKVNHYGLHSYEGRGSPEIDIIESMQGASGKLPNTHIQRPYQSASLQLAPGIEFDRPQLGHRPHKEHWYQDLEYGNITNSDLNPFFYGVKLEHAQQQFTYQADAISANNQLNDTHYQQQHIYRVEWEPPSSNGTGGYIKWFTDHELVFGVYGSSLDIMQTKIPDEPMYLILNVAVAQSWGFPYCPDWCDCTCFECGNPSCSCALPVGYCNNLPAFFEIDYVRVYQAATKTSSSGNHSSSHNNNNNESEHVLGCSPPNKPTALFIEGHEDRYKVEGQKKPLLPISHGGGLCSTNDDCNGGITSTTNSAAAAGGGTCSSAGKCICSSNYTGPNCLAHAGCYDFDRAPNQETLKSTLTNMVVPKSLMVVIAILIVGFAMSMARLKRVKSRESKYSGIGNATLQQQQQQQQHHAHYQQPTPSGQGSAGHFTPIILQAGGGGTIGPDGLATYTTSMPSGGAGQSGSRMTLASNASMASSYQNPDNANYAIPPSQQQQKVVTYCVIDGRLVGDDNNNDQQQAK